MAVELYDEHEQGERVRSWLRQNGAGLVFAVVLALGSVFGYRQWQEHQVNQQSLAADLYQSLQLSLDAGRIDEAASIQMRLDALGRRSGYAALGAMLLASGFVEDGQLEPAAQQYRAVLAQRRWQSLWPVASLRLARILLAQGDYDEGLRVLNQTAHSAFQAAAAELRGDLWMAKGDMAAAHTAYAEALAASQAPDFALQLLQTKLDATAPIGSAGES